VPQMPQWKTLMLMSMWLNGLSGKEDHAMVPEAVVLSWPSQPWKEVGDVMGVVWLEELLDASCSEWAAIEAMEWRSKKVNKLSALWRFCRDASV
jgi:hypothetical protein